MARRACFRSLSALAVLAAALLLSLSLSPFPANAVIVSTYTKTAVIVIDGVAYDTPQWTVEITCNTGDTYLFYATETIDQTTLNKQILVSCGGVLHAWDVVGVSAAPIAAMLIEVVSNIRNAGLMSVAPGPIIKDILATQRPEAGMVYVPNGPNAGGTPQTIYNNITARGVVEGEDLARRSVAVTDYEEDEDSEDEWGDLFESSDYAYTHPETLRVAVQLAEFKKRNNAVLQLQEQRAREREAEWQGDGRRRSTIGKRDVVDTSHVQAFLNDDGSVNCGAVSAAAGASQINACIMCAFGLPAAAVLTPAIYALCGGLSNQIKSLQDSSYTASNPNYANTAYAGCQQYTTNAGTNGLHSCIYNLVNVDISIQQALDATVAAVKGVEAQLLALTDVVNNIYARQLADETQIAQTLADIQQIQKFILGVNVMLSQQTAISASLGAGQRASSQTEALNSATLAAQSSQLFVDQQNLQAQDVTYMNSLQAQFSAALSLEGQTQAQALIQVAAKLQQDISNEGMARNLQVATQAAASNSGIETLRNDVSSLTAFVNQLSGIVVQTANTLKQSVMLQLYPGFLGIDYWRGRALAEAKGFKVFGGYPGTPPANLTNGQFTIVALRVLVVPRIAIVRNFGGVATSRACPLPSTIAPFKATMDAVYKSVTLPAVQVPKALDRNYLKYNQTVVLAFANTSTPDSGTTYYYVTGNCDFNQCGTCSSLGACLTTQIRYAVKMQLVYVPTTPNASATIVQGESVLQFQATPGDGVIPASPIFGKTLAVSAGKQCLDVTYRSTNNVSMFQLHFAVGGDAPTDLVRYTNSLSLSMPYMLPNTSVQQVVFASASCLGTSASPSATPAYAYLVPSFAWGVPVSGVFGRSVGEESGAGADASGTPDELLQRLAEWTQNTPSGVPSDPNVLGSPKKGSGAAAAAASHTENIYREVRDYERRVARIARERTWAAASAA